MSSFDTRTLIVQVKKARKRLDPSVISDAARPEAVARSLKGLAEDANILLQGIDDQRTLADRRIADGLASAAAKARIEVRRFQEVEANSDTHADLFERVRTEFLRSLVEAIVTLRGFGVLRSEAQEVAALREHCLNGLRRLREALELTTLEASAAAAGVAPANDWRLDVRQAINDARTEMEIALVFVQGGRPLIHHGLIDPVPAAGWDVEFALRGARSVPDLMRLGNELISAVVEEASGARPTRPPRPVTGVEIESSTATGGRLWVQSTATTEVQWGTVAGHLPCLALGPNHPVVRVDWVDALLFCNLLSRRDGLAACYEFEGPTGDFGATDRGGGVRWLHEREGYRLPTEREWLMIMARDSEHSDPSRVDEVAWHEGNAGLVRPPVAAKRPSSDGLHDMLGGVLEWLWTDADRDGAEADRAGVAISARAGRVTRGGAWRLPAELASLLGRRKVPILLRNDQVGIRVVRGATKSLDSGSKE